jgi:3,5-epimerase/4-reductase
MNILVYGSNGWIGGQFIKILEKHCLRFSCGKARADNVDDLNKEIETVLPTHVVSFIGRTHGNIGDNNYTTIDYLQDHTKLNDNVRDNLYSPLVLAIICEKKNIHFTYLGTGCLFQYDELHPYGNEETGFCESDVPNFFGSHYSTVKGFTDRLMHLFENTLNLRIRMCLTSNHHWRNFVTKLITYDKICSIPNSMTVLPELIPIMIDMAIKKVTGTVNLTNPGLISHNEILEMYKEIINPEFTWNNMSLQEQSFTLAAGRSNNYLDVSRLKELYPNVKHIKEAVRECLLNYKK